MALGVPPLGWQLIFFVAPLCVLVAMSFWSVRSFRLTPDFTVANWTFLLHAGFFWSGYLYSLELATGTAVLVSLLAFPAAYLLAFNIGAPLRRIAQFLLVIPFFTNYPIRIYSWQVFLAQEGIINYALGAVGIAPVKMMGTPGATMLGLVTLTLPLVLLMQSVALAAVDRDLIQAALNLGARPGRTVTAVIIPAARVGLVMAAAFAFIMAFGDFVSPALLGASKPPTLSTLVSDQVRSGNNWPRASVVAVSMVVTLMVVISVLTGLAYAGRGRR